MTNCMPELKNATHRDGNGILGKEKMQPQDPQFQFGCKSWKHLAVGESSVVVMTPLHGENLLKKQTNTKFFIAI